MEKLFRERVIMEVTGNLCSLRKYLLMNSSFSKLKLLNHQINKFGLVLWITKNKNSKHIHMDQIMLFVIEQMVEANIRVVEVKVEVSMKGKLWR